MAADQTAITIVGYEGSLPRLAMEVAALLGWTDVTQSAAVPASGSVFVAMSNAQERLAAVADLPAGRLVTLIHPSASVSPSATLGTNVMVGPQVVVAMDAVVGDAVVASSLSSIEHDNQIGRGTFLGSGAILCGGVTTGEFTFVGGGAVVKPGVSLGAHCTVGTGAVVIRDTDAHSIMVGNPAKPLGS